MRMRHSDNSFSADQATVQAALAALPTDMVNMRIPRSDPKYASYAQYGNDALVTGIFCILICGSLGTLLIRYFSPFLLEKVSPYLLSPILRLSEGYLCWPKL